MKFPAGYTFTEKLITFWYRVFGCKHPIENIVDLGDEEHQVVFCTRCTREL